MDDRAWELLLEDIKEVKQELKDIRKDDIREVKQEIKDIRRKMVSIEGKLASFGTLFGIIGASLQKYLHKFF